MQTNSVQNDNSKKRLLNEIYKLSIIVESSIPGKIFQPLIKCYLKASIYMLKTYPLNKNQLGYVTGNYLAGISFSRDAIKSNSDLIRYLSENEIYSGSLVYGMRNFGYILDEQKELSFSEVEHVRSLLTPLICHFVFRQEPLQILIRKAQLIYNEIRKTNAELFLFKM